MYWRHRYKLQLLRLQGREQQALRATRVGKGGARSRGGVEVRPWAGRGSSKRLGG